MRTFENIAREEIELLFRFLNNNSYRAHICQGKKPETLKEHIVRVINCACLLVRKHHLDSIIDKLITDWTGNENELYCCWVKRMFINTFVFHDSGKVNENFQLQCMSNKAFHKRKTDVLQPPHGHSFLGSWLYLSFILDQIWDNPYLSDDEKKQLWIYAFFFSYVIKQHHASALGYANEDNFFKSFANSFDELQEYLTVWGYKGDWKRIKKLFINIIGIRKETEANRRASFSLYAIVKLNSSLLTTADYFATYEYINGSLPENWGLFEERERIIEIINHLRQYKHNRIVYDNLDCFIFRHPTKQSGANLNHLRTEMAVEVIQTIRNNPAQQLFYIEAPTGGGKSNLSMIAVTELLEKNLDIQKIFYVFPFTTLITQTFQTLQKTLGLTIEELAELHSKAAFDESEESVNDGLYDEKRKNYIDRLFALYPVCVMSHVKFFDILKTNKKEANYLFHRLANSVVIIDELQTYNPLLWDKMYYMIGQYAHLFNMRFIVMSATLPKIGQLNIPMPAETEFVNLLPHARKYILNSNFAERVKFRFDLFEKQIDIAYLAKFLIEQSKEYAVTKSVHGTVHTIVEFIYKKTASEFYSQIQEMDAFFDEVLVLSGTILESRRREVIYYLKNPCNRNKNILLITTQVVEAGVDIDMDLGFKNSSLVDSDEQLAGRVNRNSLKKECEVYIFRLDEAKVLYEKDERFKIMQEISFADYEQILTCKNFARVYELVFEKIDLTNQSDWIRNLYSNFLQNLKKLNFTDVDKEFKIIEEQNNISIFVPLNIPLEIDSDEEGVKEKLFSDTELEFLKCFGLVPEQGLLDGKKVWDVYKQLIINSSGKGFNLDRQINFKIIQRIMSWFTFSLMYHSRDSEQLRCGMGEETLGYFYFSHWSEEGDDGPIYDYKMGINTKAFKDIGFI